MKLIVTLIVIFLISTIKVSGQSDYAKYIVADSLKKTHVVKNKYGDEKINYLGAIKKTNGDTLYYIVTVFSRVKAARVMHGHSNIIYLGRDFKEKKRYDVGLPEELPYKLKNNTLFFKYLDEESNKTKIFKNKVGTTLPKIMCVGPDLCG
jgi:hypothetical protein